MFHIYPDMIEGKISNSLLNVLRDPEYLHKIFIKPFEGGKKWQKTLWKVC